MTVFSPNSVGRVLTRKSIVARGRHDQAHAAVLRHALFGDVELGQHLDARDQLFADRQRRLAHARAARRRRAGGCGRTFRTARSGCRRRPWLIASIRILLRKRTIGASSTSLAASSGAAASVSSSANSIVRFVAGQVAQVLLGALGEARQQGQQGVVRHDHRFDRGLALELDLVQRLGIGRVRHAPPTSCCRAWPARSRAAPASAWRRWRSAGSALDARTSTGPAADSRRSRRRMRPASAHRSRRWPAGHR